MTRERYVYSVRRARKNLVASIRQEVESALGLLKPLPHSWAVAKREAAIRDLVASVRKEAR
jgi:hypothetical protein